MPVGIVHLFEKVDVEQNQAELIVRFTGLVELAADKGHKTEPVKNLGQRVGVGHFPQEVVLFFDRVDDRIKNRRHCRKKDEDCDGDPGEI